MRDLGDRPIVRSVDVKPTDPPSTSLAPLPRSRFHNRQTKLEVRTFQVYDPN